MSLRVKLLLPLVLGTLALAGYLRDDAGLVLSWGALCAAATLAATEYWVRRPVRDYTALSSAMAEGRFAAAFDHRSRDEIGQLGEALAQVRASLAREHGRASFEAGQRRAAEQATRESEERYALAVSGANDGLWEWNLQSGAAYFSPRWRSMLGLRDEEPADDVSAWQQRIHPDDRARALGELEQHLQGRTPRYESEQRLRHADGRWRWVLVRGALIRTASGRPHRLVGLNTDITATRRIQEIVVGLSRGLDTVHGQAFFDALVTNFATVLGVRRAFITECCDESRRRVRQLARWDNGGLGPPREYDVAGTSCEEVLGQGRSCVYASGVGALFPGDAGFEAYVGIPIFDTGGRVIGHLACLDPAPLADEVPVELIFTLYATRAGLEMERRQVGSRAAPAA